MNQTIESAVLSIRNHNISEWAILRARIEQEHRESIPEVKVIEALRLYLDGVWAGPIEGKRLWNEVLVSLNELDKFKEEHILTSQPKKREVP